MEKPKNSTTFCDMNPNPVPFCFNRGFSTPWGSFGVDWCAQHNFHQVFHKLTFWGTLSGCAQILYEESLTMRSKFGDEWLFESLRIQ